MATGKLNYWLKLRKDFLTSDAFGFLMSLPNPGKYVVFYWQLCSLAINTGGELQVKVGKIKMPFDREKIRQECKFFSAEEVSEGLQILEDLGLIICQRNGVYKIVDFDKMVGSETDYAAQKREQRNKKSAKSDTDTGADKPMDTGVDNGVDIVHTDIRDKRLDIRDIDIKSLDISISGGDDAREAVKSCLDFFHSRGLILRDWYGTSEELTQVVNNLTDLIFQRFTDRKHTYADMTAVFHVIAEYNPDTGVRKIQKDSLDLLLYSFEQAAMAGKPGNWNYINGILANLAQRGIKTLADAENFDYDRFERSG